MTFTPGPWKQSVRGPNNCPLIGADGVLIAMVSTGIDFEDQAEGNACLIEAAPELLEGLEELLFAADGLVAEAYLRDARAIIAKARGEAK